MSLVKVSVENIQNNEKILYEIDTKKTLESTIQDICKRFQMPYSSTIYGLKLVSTNDGKSVHTHISVDNYNEIKDGYFLKIVYSLNYMVKRICDHIDDDYKERSFQDLHELSIDPEFIKELVKAEKHHLIMKVFTTDALSEYEAIACLITIVHLIQKLFIIDINEKFLEKIIEIVKTSKNFELIKYALSVLHKILCHRDTNFAKWKEEIIRKVTVNDLMVLVKNKRSKEDQYGALLVINNLIRCCKGDKRQLLIKEIDQKPFKESIYENIISRQDLDKPMAHELYVYQTHLLSVLSNALNTVVSDTQSILEEFEPVNCDLKKMSLLIEFDENGPHNKLASREDLQLLDDVRISLASLSSKYSDTSRNSNRVDSIADEIQNYEKTQPCLLTIEALRHYRKYHFKNFHQSQVEEASYQPGIIASSERVVKMMAKILHIGVDPERTCTIYQPAIFITKAPYFFELFSRCMWLLSKTRREMKASTLHDYDKVIAVLSKQVKLALKEKAMDLKKLTKHFIDINYQVVVDIWQKEKDDELAEILDKNPCIQSLKIGYAKKNEELIFQQRLKYVKAGTIFPKFNDKKVNGNFMAKISNNNRDLLLYDYHVPTKQCGKINSFRLADVEHIIDGKRSPLVINNAVKEPSLAFSLIINHNEWINFKAADNKSAAYWLDALNLLTEKQWRSVYYHKEKSDLMNMDLTLHLIELQNVPIPKAAPVVPKLPFSNKPNIPPKPQNYGQMNKKK